MDKPMSMRRYVITGFLRHPIRMTRAIAYEISPLTALREKREYDRQYTNAEAVAKRAADLDLLNTLLANHKES